jgi:recombination protein RecT
MTTENQTLNINGTALAKAEKPPSAQAQIKAYLEKNQGAVAQVLTANLKIDRVMKIVLSATLRNADLLECTHLSILQSVMYAVQLGLEPGSPLGHSYLVPFKKTCQLIVGYRGFIELAQRGGVKKISARVVYENDFFEVEFGLEETIRHRPTLEPGQMIAVYAVATLQNGERQFEVMTRAQVESIRRRSAKANSGPWVSDYDEMAKKTVTRRLCKYLPLSIEAQDAIAKANAIDDDDDTPLLSSAPERSQLAAKIEASADLDDAPLSPPPVEDGPPPREPPPEVLTAEFSPSPPLAFNLKPPSDPPISDRTASDDEVATICKQIFGCGTAKDLAELKTDLEKRRAAKTLNLTKDQGVRIRQTLESKEKSLTASQAK